MEKLILKLLDNEIIASIVRFLILVVMPISLVFIADFLSNLF